MTAVYLYNGKENNPELGLNWLSFGFREYDPAIGRFTGVDPIADKFAFVSGFNYAENSPIRYIDLWGLQRAEYDSWSDPGLIRAGADHQETRAYQKDVAKKGLGGTLAAPGAILLLESLPAFGGFIANELKDEVLSEVTNGASDYLDLTKMAKKGIKAGFHILSPAQQKKALSGKGDYVVTPDGTSVSTDLNKVQEGFDNAGFKKVETNPSNVIYEVPKADGSGTFYSRLQQGKNPRSTGVDGDRVVNTQNTGDTRNRQYVNPTGSSVTGPLSKEQRKATGHIHLEPKPNN